MRVFVTGASGLVGSRLCRELVEEGHQVVALSRRPQQAAHVEWVHGDVVDPGPWQDAVDGCDAVIHLAGESIADGRWSAERKKRLVASRVTSAGRIVEAIGQAKSPPRSLLSASAVGFYGPRGEEELHENSSPGEDFLSQLCVDWEAAAAKAQRHGVRVVCLRFGVVLSARGGALKKMLPPFRLGLGGPLGPGSHWFPWVHEDDAIGIARFALEASWAGPVNVVGREPVRMGEFARRLGRALGRPAWLPIPLVAMRLALGEMGASLSPGQKVIPAVAEYVNYPFKHPELAGALAACLGEETS